MDFDAPASHGKKNLVIVIVVVGIVVLGVGAYVAFTKRGASTAGTGNSTASGNADGVKKWCKLRKEWAQKADPLAGDITLKAVSDPKAAVTLREKRNGICAGFAAKVQAAVKSTGPDVVAVETELIKEGKRRANIYVEIGNLLTNLQTKDFKAMRRDLAALQNKMKNRLQTARAKSDTEVGAALKKLDCRGIYRGPMTTAATASSPYTSWAELEFRRSSAIKRLKERLELLAPIEQLTNKVYHRLIAKYGGTLRRCYAKIKKKTPGISSKMDLRVRLKADGKVKSLAIERMEVRSEDLLTCMLNKAARWRFAKPAKANDYVVVSIDFASL